MCVPFPRTRTADTSHTKHIQTILSYLANTSPTKHIYSSTHSLHLQYCDNLMTGSTILACLFPQLQPTADYQGRVALTSKKRRIRLASQTPGSEPGNSWCRQEVILHCHMPTNALLPTNLTVLSWCHSAYHVCEYSRGSAVPISTCPGFVEPVCRHTFPHAYDHSIPHIAHTLPHVCHLPHPHLCFLL